MNTFTIKPEHRYCVQKYDGGWTVVIAYHPESDCMMQDTVLDSYDFEQGIVVLHELCTGLDERRAKRMMSNLNELADPNYYAARKIGNDEKLLMKRFREAISVMTNEFRQIFSGATFMFCAHRMISKDGRFILQWNNDGKSNRGSCSVHEVNGDTTVV